MVRVFFQTLIISMIIMQGMMVIPATAIEGEDAHQNTTMVVYEKKFFEKYNPVTILIC
jgi:hypothetical protein